jgi:hypothetical protein
MQEEEDDDFANTIPNTSTAGKQKGKGMDDTVMYSDEEEGHGMSQKELQVRFSNVFSCRKLHRFCSGSLRLLKVPANTKEYSASLEFTAVGSGLIALSCSQFQKGCSVALQFTRTATAC